MSIRDTKDAMGDRMKAYENQEAGRRFIPYLPVYARIDGRSFSKFTKNMKRPYDPDMADAMIQTTRALVHQTNACIGYTQSDEISLVWYAPSPGTQIFFDGRIQKMTSQLSAIASVHFMRQVAKHWPEKLESDNLPTFDARVFSLPTLGEAANCILWREMDATKNSISMLAQTHFSHKSLQHKSGNEMLDMLMEKGINWNDCPAFFKRGTYIQRSKRWVEMTEEQYDQIPQEHWPEDGKILRSRIEELSIPPLLKVANRKEVIFDGADPVTTSEIQQVNLGK